MEDESYGMDVIMTVFISVTRQVTGRISVRVDNDVLTKLFAWSWCSKLQAGFITGLRLTHRVTFPNMAILEPALPELRRPFISLYIIRPLPALFISRGSPRSFLSLLALIWYAAHLVLLVVGWLREKINKCVIFLAFSKFIFTRRHTLTSTYQIRVVPFGEWGDGMTLD